MDAHAAGPFERVFYGHRRRAPDRALTTRRRTTDGAELAAVLAHEIGHYKLKHIPKGMILGCLSTLAGFYVLSLILHWPPLYEAFGRGAWPADSHTPLGVAQGFADLASVIAGPLTFGPRRF